jgi:hypothetical protein
MATGSGNPLEVITRGTLINEQAGQNVAFEQLVTAKVETLKSEVRVGVTTIMGEINSIKEKLGPISAEMVVIKNEVSQIQAVKDEVTTMYGKIQATFALVEAQENQLMTKIKEGEKVIADHKQEIIQEFKSIGEKGGVQTNPLGIRIHDMEEQLKSIGNSLGTLYNSTAGHVSTDTGDKDQIGKTFQRFIEASTTMKSEIGQIQTDLAGDKVKMDKALGEMKKSMQNMEKSGTGGVSGKTEKLIMDHKGIIDMKCLDNKGYWEWSDKFKNKLEQARPGSKNIMNWIEKNKKLDLKTSDFDGEGFDYHYTWESFGSELMQVLIDKTEGEARGKVKSIRNQNDGINAYRVIHQWFTSITGQGVAEKRSRVMITKEAANDQKVVEAIEKWEKEQRELEEIEGEEPLKDRQKITGIINIIPEPFKTTIKRKDWDDYDHVRRFIMKWAMRVREEHNEKSMDVDGVLKVSEGPEPEQNQDWEWDVSEGWGDQNWPAGDIHAMGYNKGKGKGSPNTQYKGYGKGAQFGKGKGWNNAPQQSGYGGYQKGGAKT